MFPVVAGYGWAESQPDPGITYCDGVVITVYDGVPPGGGGGGLLPLTVHAALHQGGGGLTVLDVDCYLVAARVAAITADHGPSLSDRERNKKYIKCSVLFVYIDIDIDGCLVLEWEHSDSPLSELFRLFSDLEPSDSWPLSPLDREL